MNANGVIFLSIPSCVVAVALILLTPMTFYEIYPAVFTVVVTCCAGIDIYKDYKQQKFNKLQNHLNDL